VRLLLLVVIFVGSACSTAGTAATSTTESEPTAPQATTTLATITIEQLPLCPPADVVITDLPDDFSAVGADPDRVARDVYTSVPGSWSAVWADAEGGPVMALVRGSLPPESWVGVTNRVSVADRQAALGPLPDGVWGVAWFDSENRCDLYTLVLYPPATVDDARRVAESIERR